jgi:hypothetical protein
MDGYVVYHFVRRKPQAGPERDDFGLDTVLAQRLRKFDSLSCCAAHR